MRTKFSIVDNVPDTVDYRHVMNNRGIYRSENSVFNDTYFISFGESCVLYVAPSGTTPAVNGNWLNRKFIPVLNKTLHLDITTDSNG